MKHIIVLITLSGLAVQQAAADIPVIDKANLAVARQTAATTQKILDANKQILSNVEQTLNALTGDRGSEAGALKDLAIGNGFSVSALPAFDGLMKNGVADFGALNPEIARSATLFINGLQLVRSLSGRKDGALPSDRSYEELVKAVLGVSALVNGSRQSVATRRSALEQAGAGIGASADIKGSIDQNTQLQVQTGLTMNEMIGVMNGAVQSLLAENQRRLTDMSNTRKALSYGK